MDGLKILECLIKAIEAPAKSSDRRSALNEAKAGIQELMGEVNMEGEQIVQSEPQQESE